MLKSSVALGIVVHASGARATDVTSAAPEVLFREGKQLMAKGDLELACPKLAESFRLEPATGALLATALCYERAGKLATAWATYTQAAGRAKAEGSPDREQNARAKANELEGKLDRLVVSVTPGNASEILVTRDGVTIGEAAWGTPIPVDPGAHVIEATAAGKTSFHADLTTRGATTTRVVIPVLADAAPAARPPPAPDSESAPPLANAEKAKPSFWTPLRIAGTATAGLGVVALGVGSVFGVKARSLKADSNADGHCTEAGCDPTGTKLRNQARDAGTVSTIAMASGGVLLAGGITLIAVGAPSSQSVSLSLRPNVALGSTLSLGGSLTLTGKL